MRTRVPGLLAICAFSGCMAAGSVDPMGEPDEDFAPTVDGGLGDSADDGTAPGAKTETFGFCKDNWLSQADSGLNFGSQARIRVQDDPGEVGLVWFPIESLPASTTVVSATLRLHTYAAESGSELERGTIGVYRMLESWDEGPGGRSPKGDPAPSNWTQREAGQKWTAAGAGAGSRSSVQAGRFRPDRHDTDYTVELVPSEVQELHDAGNFGFALVASGGNDEAVLTACDSLELDHFPSLTITYR